MNGHRTYFPFVICHHVFGDDRRGRAVAALVGGKVLHQHPLDCVTLRQGFKRWGGSVNRFEVVCCDGDDRVFQLVTTREDQDGSSKKAE